MTHTYTPRQSFADHGGPGPVAGRIAALRERLRAEGLAGFFIPRADRHQNEYLPPDQERLLWATGFSGSAGLAVVLMDSAALFVDGRYTVQAAEQTDGSVFNCRPAGDGALAEWLKPKLKQGDALGFDAWNHTQVAVEALEKICAQAGARLAPLQTNPIDALWNERPAPSPAPFHERPAELAGETAQSKLARLVEADYDGDAVLISDAHNVAWLFNIRGADVAHTPLPLAFAFAPRKGKPVLFAAPERLDAVLHDKLEATAELLRPDTLEPFLAKQARDGRKTLFDTATAPFRLIEAYRAAGGSVTLAPDPLTLMKACKNEVEIAATRATHVRDGAALTRFLAWFDSAAASGKLTEIDAAVELERLRAEDPKFRDLSFPTISAAGPHAALPHYRVGEGSNISITPGLFLIDSGAQYEDGTTDITRTIAVGDVTDEMRDRYTRVLKGHIAIATRRFPKDTTGAQIDAFARAALWDAGLDFDHGTGHGVGAFLSVHEGPQRVAKTGTVALKPGMIVSNEPGYYAKDKFGIRIENLLLVAAAARAGDEREMLGFATISFAPIDLRPVKRELLDAKEIEWLNDYHAQVRETIEPLVDNNVRDWLQKATRNI